MYRYNVDGFFVAKFQKVGPSPVNVAKDNAGKAYVPEEEVIDKTPIATDENVSGQEDDGFGGFDDEEDEKYIEKAKRNAMRRRGLDPKALDKKKGADEGKTNGKVTEKASEKASDKPSETASDTPSGKVVEKPNRKVSSSSAKTDEKTKSKSKKKA